MRLLFCLICVFLSPRTQDAGPVTLVKAIAITAIAPAPVSPHEILLTTFVEHGLDTITAKILVAQASFESGGFTNPLTKISNNCFALLHNPYRNTYSYGAGGRAEGRSGYAEYKTLEDAAKDFIIFLEYRKLPKKLTDISVYARKLKQKHYYGSSASLYAHGMRVHYKKLWS